MGIKENLDMVRKNIETACAACGRGTDEVKLIDRKSTRLNSSHAL